MKKIKPYQPVLVGDWEKEKTEKSEKANVRGGKND